MKTAGRRKSSNVIDNRGQLTADPFLAAAKVFNQGEAAPTPRPPPPGMGKAIDEMLRRGQKKGLPKTTKKQDRLRPANVWRVSD